MIGHVLLPIVRSTFRHVSEHQSKDTLNAVLDSERRAFDALPVGVAVIDRRSHVAFVNRVLYQMLGHPAGALTGRPVGDIVEGDIGPLSAAAANADGDRPSGTLLCDLRHGDGVRTTPAWAHWARATDGLGEDHPIILTITPFDHAPSEAEAATALSRGELARLRSEVAALRRAKISLRQAREEADEANAAKTRFLAAASHDLRQPLHALAIIQGLLSQRGDTSDLDLLDDMRSNLASISELLDTFLYVSKLETGTIRPTLSDIPLADLLSRLAAELAPMVRDADLKLRVVPTSLVIRSDRVLLEQILRNFLWNAVHYTAEGGIVFGCRRRAGTVIIQVADSGIGIPEDQLGTIFQSFRQLDHPDMNTTRGLGLGLAIVDQVARILRHRVTVRSHVGRGSVFGVEVPLARGRGEPHRPSRLVADLPGLLIALIEDDERVLKVTRRLLVALGCQVVSGSSAEAVLQGLAEHTRVPDLALVDFRLHREQNGLVAVEQLRAALDRPVPVIIITGDTSPETVRRIEESGHAHLHKPVDLARLQTVMRQLLLTSAPS